ncbi:hypothetical protein BC629DRAFT_1042727 [Irpex lacteus]|nr:hypothetical protein BC629DRAFT_1042727 [Irpex lacteus]
MGQTPSLQFETAITEVLSEFPKKAVSAALHPDCCGTTHAFSACSARSGPEGVSCSRTTDVQAHQCQRPELERELDSRQEQPPNNRNQKRQRLAPVKLPTARGHTPWTKPKTDKYHIKANPDPPAKSTLSPPRPRVHSPRNGTPPRTLTGSPPTSQKGNRPTPPPRPCQRSSRRTCFGCGSPGHVMSKCFQLEQREKRGEFRRIGLSLELTDGRVLRKQNRDPPPLSQLDELRRQIEGERDLRDKSCSTSPKAPRPDKATVSISNKQETHRLPKFPASLEPTPPDPIVYRSVAVATSPPPTPLDTSVAPSSERVRAVIRHNMDAPFAVCVPPEPEQSVAYVIVEPSISPPILSPPSKRPAVVCLDLTCTGPRTLSLATSYERQTV